MTANLFTYNYKQMIFASIILGWIDCIIGLYASYVLNVPSGATIIFVSIMAFMLSKTIKALQNKLYNKDKLSLEKKWWLADNILKSYKSETKLSPTYHSPIINYTPNWYWQLLYAEEYSEEPLVAFLQRPL